MNTKKQNKKKKGFTLIELIIVIAIIAILAAIAIPNFLGIQRKSKIKADIASAKTIYDATSAAIAEGKIADPKTTEGAVLIPGIQTDKEPGKSIEGNLQTIPSGKYTDGVFMVTITPGTNGLKPSIKVEIVPKDTKEWSADAKGTLVYPNGDNEYKINNLDGASATK